jgi:hypothetical protein
MSVEGLERTIYEGNISLNNNILDHLTRSLVRNGKGGLVRWSGDGREGINYNPSIAKCGVQLVCRDDMADRWLYIF